jgi:Major Facilitator Superfamily
MDRVPVPTAAPRRTLTAALAGAGIAWGALSYVALTIGVLAEGYGYSLTQAAGLASVELGFMALASMSGGLILRHLSVRTLAALGATLAGVANVATAFSAHPVAVGAARALAGWGLGWMAAGLNTSLSRSEDPERLFIRANFGCITIAAAFFYVMPIIYERTSQPVYFIAYGILCLAGAGFMRWLPVREVPAAQSRASAPRLGARRFGIFLAVSLLWLGYAAVWSLIERLGTDLGMSEEAIGRSMGLGTLSGLLGAGAAAWMAGRIRPLGPLILTSLSTGLCYVWLVYCRGDAEYTWILCIWGVVFCPILAYAYAVGTEIDPSGALGRMIGGGTAITTALGPVVGAHLKNSFGVSGVGFATFAGTAIACAAFALLAPRGRGLFARLS